MLLKIWYTPMDILDLPTKRNLLLARQRLALARKGYELLDKKRQVLINELSGIQGQAGKLREELREALHKAFGALSVAQSEMGQEGVQKVKNGIPKNFEIKIGFRSIMGADLPLVNSKIEFSKLKYMLSSTTTSFDEAIQALKQARSLIISWAELENTTHRLRIHIKKTQKRANALGNITIPQCEARIKFIQERLEERERDELARLKLAKKKGENG